MCSFRVEDHPSSATPRARSNGFRGLALILAFIGVKLILEFVIPAQPLDTVVSLGVFVAMLVATTIAGVIKSNRDPGRHADAAALRPGSDWDQVPDAAQSDPPESDEVRPVA